MYPQFYVINTNLVFFVTLILLFFSKFQEEEEDLVESEEDEIKPNGVNSSHNKAWRKTSKDFFF